MQVILEPEHKSITELYESVQSANETVFVEFNALAIALVEIQCSYRIYTDFSAPESALKQLLHGTLTPTLISVAQMKDAFTEAALKLTPEDARCVIPRFNRSMRRKMSYTPDIAQT
jgi:hypothetical protein